MEFLLAMIESGTMELRHLNLALTLPASFILSFVMVVSGFVSHQ